MNADAIRKLRIKFIVIAMLSLFVAMGFIGFAINMANYRTTIGIIYQVLDHIVENDGVISTKDERDEFGQASRLPDALNPQYWQYQYTNAFRPHYWQYQYYSCIFDAEGNILDVIDRLDGLSDEEDLKQYALMVLQGDLPLGRYGRYYFQTGTTSGGSRLVVFIDATTEIATTARLIYWTLLLCNVGLIITFIPVWFFSKRMIQPEIENSRKQREFITNASHELKTPLSVIRANVELEEIMNGESELSKSTLRQVDHLSGLIQNLVMIARAEEREDKGGMTDEDVSKLVEESVRSFDAVATQQNLALTCQIEPDIHRILDGSKLRQLTTILVDNAIKYCDEGGTIKVVFSSIKRGKGLQLVVSNSYEEGAKVDYSRFFDRFYREDQSHNLDKGGYGIGLSIAESICKQNRGTIKAEWKDGEISFISRLFI